MAAPAFIILCGITAGLSSEEGEEAGARDLETEEQGEDSVEHFPVTAEPCEGLATESVL